MRWLALAAVLLVGGCATDVGPSPAELKAQWDAQNVFPQNYKADLMAFLRTYLNDPTHIRGAAVSQPQRKKVGPGERYVACVRYNARNTDGNMPAPRTASRFTCRVSSTASSTGRARCARSARTRSTRRFPNWRRSRASAR